MQAAQAHGATEAPVKTICEKNGDGCHDHEIQGHNIEVCCCSSDL